MREVWDRVQILVLSLSLVPSIYKGFGTPLLLTEAFRILGLTLALLDSVYLNSHTYTFLWRLYNASVILSFSPLADVGGNIGEPVSLPDAENLARHDPYQFQWWALGLVGARPVEQKKGADKGIDGRLYFHDDRKSGQTKQIIFSVKAGHITVSHLRDLRGVVEREKAQMGVLLTMEEPTKPMKTEAARAGFYDSPWGGRHPRLQILTIEELLEGKGVDRPPHKGNLTFKKAPRVYKKQEEQPELL